MRTRKNCTYKGCTKQRIERDVFCGKHLPIVYQEKYVSVGERIQAARKVKAQEVLTALCAAVAAKYKDEGDITKAGVVVACLSHEPPRYYASVARYPDTPLRKQIVCQVGKFTEQMIYETAGAAVVALAQKWAEQNRPAPVRETMATLDEVLR